MTRNNNELKKAWVETGKAKFLKKINKAKQEDISDIFRSDKSLWKEAFNSDSKKNRVIICSDERVLPKKGEFKVGIAGQLILAPRKDKEKFIRQWKGKVKAVRSHDGCGAAEVAHGKLSGSYPVIPSDSLWRGAEESPKQTNRGENIYLRDPSAEFTPHSVAGLGMTKGMSGMTNEDLYGAVYSFNLAKALGAKFEHIKYKDMRGNKDFHDARMLFWSADPEFDPSALIGVDPSASLRMTVRKRQSYFPPHFLANSLAFGLSKNYCAKELKILVGIALGSHGFGKLFNKKKPFYIVSVGKDINEAVKLNKLAKASLSVFEKKIEFKFMYIKH